MDDDGYGRSLAELANAIAQIKFESAVAGVPELSDEQRVLVAAQLMVAKKLDQVIALLAPR